MLLFCQSISCSPILRCLSHILVDLLLSTFYLTILSTSPSRYVCLAVCLSLPGYLAGARCVPSTCLRTVMHTATDRGQIMPNDTSSKSFAGCADHCATNLARSISALVRMLHRPGGLVAGARAFMGVGFGHRSSAGRRSLR